jgi:zinc transporter ZupT
MFDNATVLLTAVTLTGFLAAHIFAVRADDHGTSSSAPLSFASGVAVAYVLLQVLPELEHHRRGMGLETPDPKELPSGRGLHLVALGGLVAFYALERWLRDEWVPSKIEGEPCEPEGPGFWVHLAAFSLYSGFFAHQLHHYAEGGPGQVLLHGSALTLHFLTASIALRRDYGRRYDRIGRWALAFSACVGWATGLVQRVPEPVAAILFAFLAGGILLNVLKEELPSERRSRIGPLLAGAAGYALLIVAMGDL